MQDITKDEAIRLAREKFGSFAFIGALGASRYITLQSKVLGVGGTWRGALEASGVDVPVEGGEGEFVGVGKKVMRESEFIATARSATMARRIANALNEHKPDKRGT